MDSTQLAIIGLVVNGGLLLLAFFAKRAFTDIERRLTEAEATVRYNTLTINGQNEKQARIDEKLSGVIQILNKLETKLDRLVEKRNDHDS